MTSSPKRTTVLSTFIITNQTVHISSDLSCTCYVNEIRHKTIDLDDLHSTYKKIIATAKEKNIAIGYSRKLKASILAISQSYPAAVKEYNDVFDALVASWKQVVDNGFPDSYCGESVFEDAYVIRNKLMTFTYRNTPIGMACSLSHDLNELLDRVKNSRTICKITL